MLILINKMDEITEHSLKSSGLYSTTIGTDSCSKSTPLSNDGYSSLTSGTSNTYTFEKQSTISTSSSFATNSSDVSSISSYNIVKDTVQDVIQMQSHALQHVKDVVAKQKMKYVAKDQFDKVSMIFHLGVNTIKFTHEYIKLISILFLATSRSGARKA